MGYNVQVTDGIYWLGVNDRRSFIFERQWPLPKGMAHNSYLVVDDKCVLMDTVENAEGMDYLGRLKGVLGGRKLDYLVINHMEPDHSGGIDAVLRAYPEVTIVGNKKTREILYRYMAEEPERFMEVADGDALKLGKYTLRFYLTPWLHWPETMMTFVEEVGLLFSGDAFGSYGALDGAVFDDEMDATAYEGEMLRYYSNIVAKYSKQVLKALDKLQGVPVKMIAATHGPVWRKDPGWPVERFRRWASQESEEGVVVAVGSMYGATLTMGELLARALVESGVKKVILHDVTKSHLSFVLRDVWRYRGLCLGAVAYNTEMFPPMAQLCDKLRHIGLADRDVALFGGCSWSGGGVNNLKRFLEDNKNLRLVGDPVEMKGRDVNVVENDIRILAKKMAEAIKR